MKQGFKVMDSDMHIIEPPDLWQRYIEPEFKDQTPRGTTNSVADLGMVGPDGTPWGRNPKIVQNMGQNRRRGHSFARNQERFKPYEDMGWTGDTQLRAMDEEGIDVAVIYPSRGLFALTVPDLDPRLAAAIARAYNAPGERRPTGTEPRMKTEPTLWAVRSTGLLGPARVWDVSLLLRDAIIKVFSDAPQMK